LIIASATEFQGQCSACHIVMLQGKGKGVNKAELAPRGTRILRSGHGAANMACLRTAATPALAEGGCIR
jgi:hypothetical protein